MLQFNVKQLWFLLIGVSITFVLVYVFVAFLSRWLAAVPLYFYVIRFGIAQVLIIF